MRVDEVLRRTRWEVNLLVCVATISLATSSFLMADASNALKIPTYNVSLVVLRVGELAIAIVGLALSTKITIEAFGLRKKHRQILRLLRWKSLEEDQKKSETTELIMDMIAFYRWYYSWIIAILAFAIAIDLLLVLTTWGLILSLELLVASMLYAHIHRSWGRKLLRVKDDEKKFSEMLGGSI